MNLSITPLLYANTSKDYSLRDYYPFGMVMPGRNFSSNIYKFGYQGSLKDDEIKGTGNSYSTFFRENDVRIAQWWSTDPKPTASWSPYVSMNDNPIWFNDPFGDIVKYKDFKSWFDVTRSKLASSDFRQEFKSLKKSDNVYEYSRVARGSLGGNVEGQVELMKTNTDSKGNTVNREFGIRYSKADPHAGDGVGRSPFHGVFEETFHAVDYELSRSTSGLSAPDAIGKVFIGHVSGDQNHEARAWNFAANYAPFAPKIVRANAGGILYQVSNPLIQQIKALQSDPYHPNPQIATWLYNGFTLNIYVPSTGGAGPSVRPPLYR